MKLSVILVAVSLGCVSADCTQSFGLSNRTTEFCEGFNLVLECSIEKTMLTVFEGNLLNCSSNEITLLHSRFNDSNGTIGILCNDGKVLGQSLPIEVSGSCYISLLCIMVTPDVVGKNVTCISDNGTAVKKIGDISIPSSTKPTTITPFTAKSPSRGEIIIYCSIFVGIVIIVMIILLSIFGFIFFKKNQQRPVQTISNEYTSTTNTKQQISTFHCAQDDEVSGYTLCMTDYDKVDIATNDNEYSHLQYPTGNMHWERDL